MYWLHTTANRRSPREDRAIRRRFDERQRFHDQSGGQRGRRFRQSGGALRARWRRQRRRSSSRRLCRSRTPGARPAGPLGGRGVWRRFDHGGGRGDAASFARLAGREGVRSAQPRRRVEGRAREAALMDSDRADEIRRRMIEQRGALRDDLDFLVAQARLKTDWRHYVRRYPWVFMGAGVVLGYFLVPPAPRGLLDPTAQEGGGRWGRPNA